MKILYTLLITLFTATIAFGQCVPNPAYTDPGFYTKSGKNKITPAVKGVSYTDTITAVIPPDTMVLGSKLTIDSIVVKKVDNLPPGLSYKLPTNTFPGGTSNCVKVEGTPTQVGTFKVNIDAVIYVQGLPAQPYKEPFDFVVSDPNDPISVELRKQELDYLKVAPNPARDYTRLVLNNKNLTNVTVKIHNLVGKTIFYHLYKESELDQELQINTSSFQPGIYIYSIATENAEKVGRLIITD